MRFLDHLFPTSKVDRETSPERLLESAGYMKRVSSGNIALLPLGKLVFDKVSSAFRNVCTTHGLWEILLPLLQRYELWEDSGRSEVFGQTLSTITIGSDRKFVVNPTQEEATLDLIRLTGMNARLPFGVFQIGERLRNEPRPAHGLIRTRTFLLGDVYHFSEDDQEEREAIECLESVLADFLSWTCLPYRVGEYTPSHLGPPAFSYWVESQTDQCIAYLCDDCGRSYRFTQDVPEECPSCQGEMQRKTAVEVGDIMHSGSSLSARMGILTASGKPIRVTLAGVGLGRLVQLLAGFNRDERGLTWPRRFSPFDIHAICAIGKEKEMLRVCKSIESEGFKVLCDTRQVSMGRKLIDCDLIGIPAKVILGRSHTENGCEYGLRTMGESYVGGVQDILNMLHTL